MRTIVILIIVSILSSCALTKHERRLNRGSRKLERLTDRFPELLSKDTVRANVSYIKPRTTIEVRQATISIPDSFVWRNGDATLIRWVVGDSTFYTVICDTVEIMNEVKIPVDRIQPVRYLPMPYKWWQKAFFWIGVFTVLFLILRTIIRQYLKTL